MGSKRVLVLALMCAVLGAVWAWQLGWLETAPAPPSVAPRAAVPAPPPFESAWATEQEWLVDSITRDIREMAHYASTRSFPADLWPAVKPQAIHFDDHLFSPLSYEPVAREALGPIPAPLPSSDGDDGAFLASLLDLRPAVLVKQDEALSGRLESEPRDAAAHERAALLLGAFSLRERARDYSDPRPALCRMAAHLGFARALRQGGDPGLSGRFAEALLASLLGRQRDALDRLDVLEASAVTPAEKAWVRALRIRTTGDWRIGRDARNLTPVEALEEVRALLRNLDDMVAFDWLESRAPSLMGDFGALVVDWGVSIELGNRFLHTAPMMALAEATEVWVALGGEPAEGERWLEHLNERPERLVNRDDSGAVKVSVLGWGLWADRAQRHLLAALEASLFQLGGLGLPHEQEAFVGRARQQFSRLEMYALFLRTTARDKEHYVPAMAAVRELALRSPERLMGANWRFIRAKVDFAPVPADLPDETRWFRPLLVPGTLLEATERLRLRPEFAEEVPGGLQALQAMAPYDFALAELTAERQPGAKRTLADTAPIYGPLGEYSRRAMEELAHLAWYDAGEYRRRYGALCDLLPERCFRLGYRLAELGFPDEAAEAYQKGFDGSRDRVFAANEADWLVEYYYERGQIEKAEAVAREAADTGAGAGLLVLARLTERLGRLDEAEELYRDNFEHYDSPRSLAGFYYRQARVAGNAEYETRFRDALALALPSGLEQLDRDSLPPQPTDGVVIRKENDNTKRFGIKWGHVIVGFDGFRVRDLRSYHTIRLLSHSPQMKLVIWRGNSYDDVEVELWDRWFNVAMEDLAPPDESGESR
jgi:tetratricopeptide (TPR) repeat protein